MHLLVLLLEKERQLAVPSENNMTPYKWQFIIVAILLISASIFIMLNRNTDSLFQSESTTKKQVRRIRIIVGIFFLFLGMMMLLGVFWGWTYPGRSIIPRN